MQPFRSASRGALPPASPSAILIGDVLLPAGHHVLPDPSYASTRDYSSTPCLWVSEELQPEVDRTVQSLVDMFETTGLWPLVLESLHSEDERPWLMGELDPSGSTDPATHNAEAVLRKWWTGLVPDQAEDDELEGLEPFGREFPGLAPATSSIITLPPIREVAEQVSGRLGLVPVLRPADVLATIGWLGPVNHYSDMGRLSAVLRSWEDRFNAFIVAVGFDTITLAVGNPPSTKKAAQAIAAEHLAACSDNIYQGKGSIEEYAVDLVDSGCWSFWWD